MNPTKEEIADVVSCVAGLLEAQKANRYRVDAYRRAAGVIADLNKKAAEIVVARWGSEIAQSTGLERLREIFTVYSGPKYIQYPI